MGALDKRSNSISSEETVTMPKALDPGFDYELPKFPYLTLSDAMLSQLARSQSFNAEYLAAAFSSGCSPLAIKTYLQSYPRATITEELKTLVQNHHLITYAVDRNSAECLQTLIEYGANPRAKAFGGVPILAVAIMRTKWTVRNATDIVKTLLANGADPRCIPADMWSDYVKAPKVDTEDEPVQSGPWYLTKWCTPERRSVMAETLNLTMCHYLWRASRFAVHMKRMSQIATAHSMTGLLKMPYQIIGQEPATDLVMHNVYAHIALNVKEPLVLGFAGLSGHGKTELATQLGSLLSVPTIDLDCAQMGQIESLLGSSLGYVGCDKGSPFNNFVTQHTGKRCVVFLDEFDKTERKVREALLKAMDTGSYRDRRTNEDVDTSKVIWILATNLGDAAIDRFHSKHIAHRKDADIDQISIEPLKEELYKLFFNVFSPAITGRINAIVPFFPFSPNEQAVVAHKFVLGLQDVARQPIDLEKPQLIYIGHSHLSIDDDGRVCQHLAKSYVKELGARSLKSAVSNVRRQFATAYSKEDEEVKETFNAKPLMKYTVQLHPVSESVEKISVFRDGDTVIGRHK